MSGILSSANKDLLIRFLPLVFIETETDFVFMVWYARMKKEEIELSLLNTYILSIMTKLIDLTLVLNLANVLIGKYELFAGYGETGPPKA